MKNIFTILFLVNLLFVNAQVQWTVYDTNNSLVSNNSYFGVAIDSLGNVWCGSNYNHILDKYDGVTWSNYYNNQISGVHGSKLIVDSKGNKWVAGDGVNVFNGLRWINYNRSNSGLMDNKAYDILIDPQNTKWIATQSAGLVKFNDTVWTSYNTSNSGIPENQIYSLARDKKGNIWLGTYSSGIVKFDGKSWTNYNSYNSMLPDDAVYAIAIDQNDNIWCGTYYGAAKFDGSHWTVYTTSNSGICGNYIGSFAFSDNGDVWIGTRGAGLSKLSGGKWTTYSMANSPLKDNRIWSISIDKNQQDIWLATLGGGIARMSLGKVINTQNEKHSFSVDVNVYPNPAISKIYVNISGLAESQSELKIYDCTGRIVLQTAIKMDQQIVNVDNLANGIYLVELNTVLGKKVQHLVVKR